MTSDSDSSTIVHCNPTQIQELTKLRDDWTGKEKADVEEILRRLEHAKKTIIDLEKKKLDLVQEEKRLSEQLEEEELACKAEVQHLKLIREREETTNTLYCSWTPRRRRKTFWSLSTTPCSSSTERLRMR